MKNNRFIARPGKKIKLADFDPSYTGKFHSREATTKLEKDILAWQSIRTSSTPRIPRRY